MGMMMAFAAAGNLGFTAVRCSIATANDAGFSRQDFHARTASIALS
jgi:hypothetical protein